MKLRVYSRICRKTDLIVTILNRRKEGIKKSESKVMKYMLLHLLYAPQGQYEREVSFSLQFCLLSFVNLVCYSGALEEIFEKLACLFFSC